MNADEKNKRVQNLFRSPQNDPKSAFYTINRLTKSLIKKAKTSFYDKDKVFITWANRRWRFFKNREWSFPACNSIYW